MNALSREPVVEHLLINGEAVDGAARLEVRNPARPSELVGTVVRATPSDVDAAVAAAKKAQMAWSKLSFAQRADILHRGLARLEEDLDARAALFTRENGKPFAQARAELLSVPKRQAIALGFAQRLDADEEVGFAEGRTFITSRPYGVVVSIVPWNSPDILAFTQFVAALLAGNGVVLKPPETCPLTLIDSVRRFASQLPNGLINVITGLPSEIGDTLTTHPDVAKIGFTGSIPAARHIMANAAQSIKGVQLELGGNDPAILLDDVELDEATIARMVASTFWMSGQVCMAIKRFYVPRVRQAEFVGKFSAAVDRLVVGDGLLPEVTLGPMHSRPGLERARSLIDDAIQRGAKVESLGIVRDQPTFDAGFFLRPTVVWDIPDDARLMKEEQFCPAVPIAVYEELDEALARSNRTEFGLGASVWSRSATRATAVARQIESGQVWINHHGILAINHAAPYGGVKQSGIGRKSGIQGIAEYLHTQTITAHAT